MGISELLFLQRAQANGTTFGAKLWDFGRVCVWRPGGPLIPEFIRTYTWYATTYSMYSSMGDDACVLWLPGGGEV